ncbi:lipocalin family protein [Actinomadura rupiterrae]|uniref:lipocalin family protein n=1 Tax=Actinomadura rupiterrae TaxID=559627 RepID=UPI0020A32CB6|nr:lipocalin family protein [Actinomadura rupiterrae]MCP2336914.1 putative secreted hydrolase [Actinomadura rupiterrae]
MIQDHQGRARRLTALWTASAAALSLLLASPASASADTVGITIPKDESPHNATREWYYYTGHLTGVDSKGKRHNYGFEQVFFRNQIQYPSLSGYAGNMAVTDLTADKFKWESRQAGQPDNIPADGGYDIAVQDWNMSGKSGSYKLGGGFQDGSYKLDLSLNQSTPPALHGNYLGTRGLIDYAQWGQSYYYSYTNLKTSGTVYDHGEAVKVTGQSWFDHQYGDFKSAYGRWDWFSIQLTNGSQYMVYLISDKTGLVRRAGTLVRPDGTTADLDPSKLSMTPTGSWTSPVTKLTYSSGWKVSVPGGQFTVTPQRRDQEVAWDSAPGGGYWEGASTVTGTVNGCRVAGQSYVEITTPDTVF